MEYFTSIFHEEVIPIDEMRTADEFREKKKEEEEQYKKDREIAKARGERLVKANKEKDGIINTLKGDHSRSNKSVTDYEVAGNKVATRSPHLTSDQTEDDIRKSHSEKGKYWGMPDYHGFKGDNKRNGASDYNGANKVYSNAKKAERKGVKESFLDFDLV